ETHTGQAGSLSASASGTAAVSASSVHTTSASASHAPIHSSSDAHSHADGQAHTGHTAHTHADSAGCRSGAEAVSILSLEIGRTPSTSAHVVGQTHAGTDTEASTHASPSVMAHLSVQIGSVSAISSATHSHS